MAKRASKPQCRAAMVRLTRSALIAALCGAFAASGALAATDASRKPTKPRVTVSKGRYGFLPGYRSPEEIDRQERRRVGPVAVIYTTPGYHPYGWPLGPGWYRSRYTMGIGPCYTPTPIGPMWNCGR